MKNVEAIRNLNETELEQGLAGTSSSWHEQYLNCPFIFVGGLPTQVTEGDLLAIFEQYGIVVHVNLVRNIDTGKSRGFGFLQYHDPRSAVLAVDNFNGIEIGGRTIKVDHADNYTISDQNGRVKGLDTTPEKLQIDTSKPQAEKGEEEPTANPIESTEQKEVKSADALRQKLVMERLQAMRRGNTVKSLEDAGSASKPQGDPEQPSDTVEANESQERPENVDEDRIEPVQRPSASVDEDNLADRVAQLDRQRYREERDRRKAERARIRESRRQRRDDRQRRDNRQRRS